MDRISSFRLFIVRYPPLDDLNWDVASGKAFFYVVTVVTTIGYGFFAPVTVPGRLMTMFLATFGIVTYVLFCLKEGKEVLVDFHLHHHHLPAPFFFVLCVIYLA